MTIYMEQTIGFLQQVNPTKAADLLSQGEIKAVGELRYLKIE